MEKRKLLFVALALAALLGAMHAAPSCKAYGEGCTGSGASSNCCTPLSCDTFHTSTGDVKICSQPAGVCTENPENWKAIVSEVNLNAPGSVKGAVEQLESGGSPLAGGSSNLYKVGWFSDWRAAGLIGVMVAILIVSLAAMAGHAFNLPEVKAFVDTELMQCVVSVILIVGLIGLITFFDGMARLYVANTDIPVNCGDTGTPCYVQVAKNYLTGVYGFGTTHAEEQLVKNVRLQAYASTGYQIQANKWWLLFAGTNIRPSAGLSIEAERAGIIFDTASKMLASIYAQGYFIDVISYGIAPILLLLGILLRTFFFTRKLGGLLLAIALALFIVYPLTYAFTWYTLQVQIYGERVSAVDPACPQECMLKAPVAFYTDRATGENVNFATLQDLPKAGIDLGNWETGGPSGDYTGLISCVNDLKLTGTGTAPANSCPDCPSYCREVPFPSGIAGCDQLKCGACNPGCKVMRTRSDCIQPDNCDPSKCSAACRTTLPVENKCSRDYFTANPSQPYSPANLSVSCSGCTACPTWCRVRKVNPDGTITSAYNDAACQVAACKSPPAGTCPDQCAYLTPIGPSNDCNAECTGCPKECRITAGYDFVPYDTEDFNTTLCSSTPSIKTACAACPTVCKATIPPDPRGAAASPMLCYPYPVKNYQASQCTDCPDYCRYTGYGFIASYSNLQMNPATLKPELCSDAKIKCADSTSPAECGGACKVQGPPVCSSFQFYSVTLGPITTYPPEFCNACPEVARARLTHLKADNTQDFNGFAALATGLDCTDSVCDSRCKPTIAIPRQDSQGAGTCKDYDPGASGANSCVKCPTDCRVDVITGLLDPKCKVEAQPGIPAAGTVCDSIRCPASCKANAVTNPAGQALTCEVYVGPGTKCVRTTGNSGEVRCELIKTDTACAAARTPGGSTACEWKTDYDCYGPTSGPVNCRDTPHRQFQFICTADYDKGCRWMQRDDLRIPIDQRDPTNLELSDAGSCKQCPEICRMGGDNDCNVEDNTLDGQPNAYVDCSLASCPATCRAEAPPKGGSVPNGGTGTDAGAGAAQPPSGSEVVSPAGESGAVKGASEKSLSSGIQFAAGPTADVCKEFIPFGLPCYGVPALCRVEDSGRPQPPQYCTGYGACSQLCEIPSAPAKACEGCFDCNYDCIYKPAVRTDCAEVCSDEALAGPVNIGPADFFKQLPGAAGETDVKNTGTMLILGVVLPLFNIVIVISFIRVFSPFLGGDIEIPGLSRII